MVGRKYAINKSQLPRYLRQAAKELGDSWESAACAMAADEIELLQQVIMRDPVEIKIEEGDRANG